MFISPAMGSQPSTPAGRGKSRVPGRRAQKSVPIDRIARRSSAFNTTKTPLHDVPDALGTVGRGAAKQLLPAVDFETCLHLRGHSSSLVNWRVVRRQAYGQRLWSHPPPEIGERCVETGAEEYRNPGFQLVTSFRTILGTAKLRQNYSKKQDRYI